MGIDKFISKVCVQTAVYWGSPTNDGYGQKTYADPVELEPPNGVRWDSIVQKGIDKGEIKTGEFETSNAKVLLVQDVEVKGWLYLGSLDDFDSTVDTNKPETIDGAYEIKKFEKIPMVKSTTIFIRTAYL